MRLINRVAMALLLVTLAGTAAMAKTHKTDVRFQNAIKVNGTLVKPGSYVVAFDDATNELSILKGGKVVAKATARLEQRAQKARDKEFQSRMEGNDSELVSVTFSGSTQDLVLGQTGMQAGGNN
jgi:hypothetical protein